MLGLSMCLASATRIIYIYMRLARSRAYLTINTFNAPFFLRGLVGRKGRVPSHDIDPGRFPLAVMNNDKYVCSYTITLLQQALTRCFCRNCISTLDHSSLSVSSGSTIKDSDTELHVADNLSSTRDLCSSPLETRRPVSIATDSFPTISVIQTDGSYKQHGMCFRESPRKWRCTGLL